MANDDSDPDAVAKKPKRKRALGARAVASNDAGTGLTVFEERFCAYVAAGHKLNEAMLLAEPERARTATPKSIKEMASFLASKQPVYERIQQLRVELRKESNYTLSEAMRETTEAMEIARTEANPGAFVSAVALRAKINGLMVEDRRNQRRPLQDLSEPELDAEIERALNDIERAKSLH